MTGTASTLRDEGQNDARPNRPVDLNVDPQGLLQHLLCRQQTEIQSLAVQLAEARKLASAAETQCSNLRPGVGGDKAPRLDAMSTISDSWLHGPATSVEHEIARRRHVAQVGWSKAAHTYAATPNHSTQRLPDAVGTPEAPSWHSPLSSPPVPEQWTSNAPSLPSVEVLVDRKRRFGEKVFRLWVEDCQWQRGVRVHAIDADLTRVHADIRDAEIQVMYNKFAARRSTEWMRAGGNHDLDLMSFLGCLLDAVYFVAGPGGIELRIPDMVEPPGAPEEYVLVETRKPQGDSSVSKGWIRQKLLVPRSSSVGAPRSRRTASTTGRRHEECKEAHSRARVSSCNVARHIHGHPSSHQSSRGSLARCSSCGRSTPREHPPTQPVAVSRAPRPSTARGPRPTSAKGSAPQAVRTLRPSEMGREGRREPPRAPDLGCYTEARRRCGGPRPSSSKARKHKRVVDTLEMASVYDDLDPSECETDVEFLLSGGSCASVVGSGGDRAQPPPPLSRGVPDVTWSVAEAGASGGVRSSDVRLVVQRPSDPRHSTPPPHALSTM